MPATRCTRACARPPAATRPRSGPPAYGKEHVVDLRAVELDVNSEDSVDAAVEQVIAAHWRIDVLVHNAGHMVTGPAEAFTPEQLSCTTSTSCPRSGSTVPACRICAGRARSGDLGLQLQRQGRHAALSGPPYFAAKAAVDSLAVSHAGELACWGVETSIVVPGSFTRGTSHFAHSGHPADGAVEAAYETKYAGLVRQVSEKLAAPAPEDADASLVSDEIARIVALPEGERPYRVHIDPADDGAEEVSDVGDRVRREFLTRIDLGDLLTPHPAAV
ncbi:SDR family NAD(P)-dependent oxidoreductase [Streptomyces cellulosae]|uniref:SDR family NAD(P)-dependent oxidoreductase n=1 Tax=Streptomyces cellulosae TaxID=1968 RepID=A0ABW7Y9E5_STRCE